MTSLFWPVGLCAIGLFICGFGLLRARAERRFVRSGRSVYLQQRWVWRLLTAEYLACFAFATALSMLALPGVVLNVAVQVLQITALLAMWYCLFRSGSPKERLGR